MISEVRRAAVVLAVLAVIFWSAYTMMRPLVVLSVLDLGGTPEQASAALAAFAVLPTLLAIPLGSLTDRFGDKRFLVWGAGGMVAGGALMLLERVSLLVVGQVVVGVGSLAVWVALQAAATSPVHVEESRQARNRRIATFSLFVAAGQLFGPLLGGWVAEALDYRASFAVFVLLSLLLVGVAPRLVSGAGRPASTVAAGPGAPLAPALARSYADALRLLRRRGVALIILASFTALVVLDLRVAFHPMYLSDIGYSPLWVGVLLSAGAAFAFLAQPMFSLLVRRLPVAVLVGSVLGVGSATVAGVVFTESLAALLVLGAVNGFAVGLAQPLTLALLADYTDQAQRGLAAGVRSMANRLAQLVDPIAFGVLLAVVGTRAAFLTMGAGLLLLSLLVAVGFGRIRHARPDTSVHPEDSAADLVAERPAVARSGAGGER